MLAAMVRVAVIALMLGSFGCASHPLTLKKTSLEKPVILKSRRLTKIPRRVIFLSKKEAECPNACSATVSKEAQYNKTIARIEKGLQQKGYSLIAGAIVSRVEDKLKDSESREQWDRTEKALLLGDATGADAIFELRSIYVDETNKNFLKEAKQTDFRQKPRKTVDKKLREWRNDQPSTNWLLVPFAGWWYYFNNNHPPSSFDVPIWEATVDARLIDLDGNVLWSGSQTIKTTDIIPENWDVRLDGAYSNSRIKNVSLFNNAKDQNFDYFEYNDDLDLQRAQLHLIIDNLIAQLPKPQSGRGPAASR